jgi:Dolichyl-phosphate-mannose-protein mannosyltransferase
LEVQGRPALAPRRLNGVVAAAWGRRWAALALATVVTVAAVIVDAQPVRSPWWTYADADASYSAAALNLLTGHHLRFVDHPGLPVTEVTAIAFGVDSLFDERSLSDDARKRYVDATLLELDSARGIFRGVSIATYLAGALLSFLLFARLFGHWTWGFAAGLLWPAAPGLIAMSIQLRPDVPLAVLSLCYAYALGRALQTRAPGAYVAASVLAGVAVMTKLHALGLIAPVLLAAAWRPPDGGWRRIVASARARPALTLGLGVVWLVAALFLNGIRVPFTPTAEQLLALLGVLVAGAAAVGLGLAVRRLRPLALVGPAFVAGLLLPVSIDIPDGLQALLIVAKTVMGEGVQAGVEPFAVPFSQLPSIVGAQVMVVFLLAAAAAVVGLIRRDPLPVVWAFAAAVMVVLAFARPPAIHYLAPGFVLAVPAVLWLLQRTPGAPASVLVWPVVVLLSWPSFRDRELPTIEAERFAAVVQPTKRVVDGLLAENEIALVPGNWPFEDARYFDLAQRHVETPPPYPFKYLSSTEVARSYAELRGWRPRYFISPVAQSVTGTQTIDVDQYGRFSVRRLPGTDLGLELLAPAP